MKCCALCSTVDVNWMESSTTVVYIFSWGGGSVGARCVALLVIRVGSDWPHIVRQFFDQRPMTS